VNGVYHKRWCVCIPDWQEHDTTLTSVIENWTEITKGIGLDDVEFGDMNEFHKSLGEDLSTED
jgi:uncharacterized protein (DUF2237 family)